VKAARRTYPKILCRNSVAAAICISETYRHPFRTSSNGTRGIEIVS
jgi:hypothetical protein